MLPKIQTRPARRLIRSATTALATALLMLACAAPAMAQDDTMKPIDIPAQPNAIVLNTGPLPGATAKESWHTQYGSFFARNVTVATLTSCLTRQRPRAPPLSSHPVAASVPCL
jgi:hypothetical protein